MQRTMPDWGSVDNGAYFERYLSSGFSWDAKERSFSPSLLISSCRRRLGLLHQQAFDTFRWRSPRVGPRSTEAERSMARGS